MVYLAAAAKMKFNYQQFEEYLEVLLAQDVLSNWRGLGVGHYRLNGELDIWPKNRKYHSITDDQWGEYRQLRDLVF